MSTCHSFLLMPGALCDGPVQLLILRIILNNKFYDIMVKHELYL